MTMQTQGHETGHTRMKALSLQATKPGLGILTEFCLTSAEPGPWSIVELKGAHVKPGRLTVVS